MNTRIVPVLSSQQEQEKVSVKKNLIPPHLKSAGAALAVLVLTTPRPGGTQTPVWRAQPPQACGEPGMVPRCLARTPRLNLHIAGLGEA